MGEKESGWFGDWSVLGEVREERRAREYQWVVTEDQTKCGEENIESGIEAISTRWSGGDEECKIPKETCSVEGKWNVCLKKVVLDTKGEEHVPSDSQNKQIKP